MIVYIDIVSGDEFFSDNFPLEQVVDADGNIVSLLRLL